MTTVLSRFPKLPDRADRIDDQMTTAERPALRRMIRAGHVTSSVSARFRRRTAFLVEGL